MFLKSILPFLILRRSNCYRSSITRISRDVYSRLYPNLLVLPDGSTIRIRYPEPRHLVKVCAYREGEDWNDGIFLVTS